VHSTVLGAGTSVVAVDSVKQLNLKEGAEQQEVMTLSHGSS
jgi:molybdopterin-binding protein